MECARGSLIRQPADQPSTAIGGPSGRPSMVARHRGSKPWPSTRYQAPAGDGSLCSVSRAAVDEVIVKRGGADGCVAELLRAAPPSARWRRSTSQHAEEES